jgi:hypothetical protein
LAQWLRSCSLSISGGGSTLTISDLRVRFTIKQTTVQSPNSAIIIITNLSQATAQTIKSSAGTGQSTGQTVTLTAGYQDNAGVLFKGDIQEARIGRENPTDTIVTIWASSGDTAYNYGVASKTFAAGATHQDHYDHLLQAFAKFGIQAGYVPPGVLSKIKFPRSSTLYGMARDHMRKLAAQVGCTWFITDDKVHMLQPGQALPGGVTVINAATGMIGMPMQTPVGVIVRCLINPALRPGQQIQLNNASIQLSSFDQSNNAANANSIANMAATSADGIYNILAINVEGDTRGNPWYQELICYGAQMTNAASSLYVPNFRQ